MELILMFGFWAYRDNHKKRRIASEKNAIDHLVLRCLDSNTLKLKEVIQNQTALFNLFSNKDILLIAHVSLKHLDILIETPRVSQIPELMLQLEVVEEFLLAHDRPRTPEF